MSLKLKRAFASGIYAGFNIRWNGTQNNQWNGNWGWEATKEVARTTINITPESFSREAFTDGTFSFVETNEITLNTEFKVSQDIIIKNNGEAFDSQSSLKDQFYGIMSVFFDPNIRTCPYNPENNANNPHFVLFAMRWCQPVWDGIEDPNPSEGQRSNNFVFVNMRHEDQWVRGLNMHIPSKHEAEENSGPYYGTFSGSSPHPRGNHHQGVDLYSGEDGHNPAFAIHAGELKRYGGSGYGYRAYLLFGGVNEPCFHYAHLNEQVTAKDWVMSGEIIGICGLTKGLNPTTYFNEPYHLHLEFISSVNTTTPPINDGKVDFSEVVNINPSDDATYFAPTGANAFLFQGNRLPLILPCRSVYCNEPDGDPSHKGCIHQTERTAYRHCYAVRQFPYTNNLLLPRTPYLVSNDLHPATGIIRYICPYIDRIGNNSVRLQIKLKFLLVNRERFTPAIFSYGVNETATFNSFFYNNINNLAIDGAIGNGTKRAIRALVRAYYYCENSALPNANRILAEGDLRISNTKIEAFVDRYVDNTIIPTDTDHNIIINFYNWFSNDIDFSNISLNTTT